MKLVQIRECDGQCCKESPRWPTVDGLSCQYLKDGKCLIKTGEQPIPTKASPTWPNKSSHEVFQETCVDWPQNSPEGRDTGGCCWQWVED
jgi:hypothetical protein